MTFHDTPWFQVGVERGYSYHHAAPTGRMSPDAFPCPDCGEQVFWTLTFGPETTIAHPCGHQLPTAK